jgi:hypothetical protein
MQRRSKRLLDGTTAAAGKRTEADMTPFRTSLTARLLSLATFVVLTGPGVAIAAQMNLHIAIPLCVAVAITLSLFGMIVGTDDQPWAVLLLSIVLPLALWGYFMGLEHIVMSRPDLAWALCASGFVPLLATIGAPRTVGKAQPEAASANG